MILVVLRFDKDTSDDDDDGADPNVFGCYGNRRGSAMNFKFSYTKWTSE